MTNEFTVEQDLFKQSFPSIFVTTVDERLLEKEIILSFLRTDTNEGRIGVSAIYGKRCATTAIAFATRTSTLVIQFSKQADRRIRRLLMACILNDPRYTKCAFKMDTLALSLFTDKSLRISNAIDLLSLRTAHKRHSLEALFAIMGGEANLHRDSVKNLFFNDTKEMSRSDVAIQAWAACQVAIISDLTSIPRIDTFKLTREASCFRACPHVACGFSNWLL